MLDESHGSYCIANLIGEKLLLIRGEQVKHELSQRKAQKVIERGQNILFENCVKF